VAPLQRFCKTTWVLARRHPQLLAVEAGDGTLREVDGEAAVVDRQQLYLLALQHFSQKYVVLLIHRLAGSE
jgi:hypothetical protein